MVTIPKNMRAVVYRGANDLRVERVPVPRIQPAEILVKVAVCGVCPTDIKKIKYGTVAPPRVFGHETAGTIVRTGTLVRGFKPGDRVALHHHVPCLKCHACRHNAFAQCPQYKRTGVTAGFEPAGGGYAEYVRVMSFVLPGVVKIPDRNSFLEGAMLEPVNTVLKAVERLRLLPGDTALVAGQGPIGLLFTRLLTLRGIAVIATDVIGPRLRLALELGAKAVFNAQAAKAVMSKTVGRPITTSPLSFERGERGASSVCESSPRFGRAGKSVAKPGLAPGAPGTLRNGTDELSALVHRVSLGRGLDAAVVAVPNAEVVRQAQQLVRGAGQVLLFSHTKRGEMADFDLATICVDEKDLIGSYSADFTLQQKVARLIFKRKLDVSRLISHEFPLEQTDAAVDLAANPTSQSLKVVVNHTREVLVAKDLTASVSSQG